jgi:hypothetical protein
MYGIPANVILGSRGGAEELACRLEWLSPKIDVNGEKILDAKFKPEFS